jgi:hypothetical protein
MAKKETVNCLSRSWAKRLKKRLKAKDRQAAKKEAKCGSII